MSIARNEQTGDITHGHELRALDEKTIRLTAYTCPYDLCNIKATPCSYRETNIKNSHFRYNDKHLIGCGIHDKKNNDHNNGDEGKNKNNSPPTPYISKLNLVVDNPANRKQNKNHNKDASQEDPRPRTASSSSIKPIIDYYENNIDIAKNQQLLIPTLGKKSYKEWFQNVINKENIKYVQPCIFHGKLFSRSNIFINKAGFIYLKFLTKHIQNAITLEIDTNNWKAGELSVFKKEFDIEKDKSTKYYNLKKQNNQPAEEYLYIYFLGHVKSDTVLTTNSFKLIYFAFKHATILPSSNVGYTIPVKSA
ncbi:Putative uncharacterized protein, partial [Moritella viscosa]|uniref:hypothetical protein n=1 Tax=Moritella viscosa TaxID=80854 RepID=UPI000914D3C8